LARAPCHRGIGVESAVRGKSFKLVLRWVAGIAKIAHDLVQTQPRLFEGIQHLRFRLVALLRHAQQRERGSANQHENSHGNQHLNERETTTATALRARFPRVADVCPRSRRGHVARRHLYISVSRVTGRTNPAPATCRAPTMKRLLVMIEPFALVVVITAQRISHCALVGSLGSVYGVA
jgi:hypothetical protein